MRYIGNHCIGMIDHPFIPFNNGILPGNLFQGRVECAIIIGTIQLLIQIRKNKHGFYNRGLSFHLPNNGSG
jgi:hypothetical protein